MIQASEKQWMVLYTRARWEKKVEHLLKQQHIESFCPLIRSKRKWADRYKIIEVPLFTSYIFVKEDTSLFEKVMQTNGVVSVVRNNGKPALINDQEIERIKFLVQNYAELQTVPIENLKVGDMVEVKEGPFMNKQGEIKDITGNSVLMVLKDLNCVIIVKTDEQKLIAVN
ncbi:UpxY family transcription antiterminator [Mucilaginibacter sp. JRF]|jgi:transcription antitermination factor NusG|uniref:UpxY family transcription antiterminator n=1 Tax=Mucilaginibacter sp. JRF TaxID=2780088 RepID=UPI00187EBC25|nr:UpxY family transcription antiterminator [Mucilaginibacter sp. JRF]MBE9585867.1 UpxY family transcription antiterminator [Mucilaginibacter sp. JRF]